MPLFDYAGQLRAGTGFQGTLDAESAEDAERILAEMGVRVTWMRPTGKMAYVAPLSLDDFRFFNEQVAALASAEIPLHEGLRHLAADTSSSRLKRLLSDLAADLSAGTPLEQAIARQRGRFPASYQTVVEAGLKTGDLAGTLYGLSAHLRLKSNTRRALLELVAYPVVILLFSLLIMSFLMRSVVPQIESMVIDMWEHPRAGYGVARSSSPTPQLPTGPWDIVFAVSHYWRQIELTIIVLAAVLCLGLPIVSLVGGARVRDRLLRAIPGISRVYWSSILARFSHTSALAAQTGTPLPELITASGAASGSAGLADATKSIAARLEQGRTLKDAASGEPLLPALWTCVVSVSANRGDLPAALSELARTYEVRAEQWTSTLRILLGPILLVLVGLVLGAAIVSMILVFSAVIESMTS